MSGYFDEVSVTVILQGASWTLLGLTPTQHAADIHDVLSCYLGLRLDEKRSIKS